MSIGVLAQKDYLKNGLQTFESRINSYLVDQDGFSPIFHNYDGRKASSIPFSRTYQLYRSGQQIKRKSEGFDKLFIPSQSRLTVDPDSVDAQIIPYVHDILPFTSSHNVQRYQGFSKIISGVQDLFFEENYMANLEKLDKVIAASEKTASDLRTRTNFSGEIEVVYQGVDGMPDPDDYERKRDIDLLYVGTLHERKNPELIKKTFKRALRNGFTVASVNYSGVDLPGKNFSDVSDEKLAELYSRSRFYLHPSFIEGFGRCPVEAQRYGCIPLGLDNDINHEVLGEPGYSWRSVSNPDEILSLLQERVESQLRNYARENSSQYTWERCRNEIREVLEEC